MSKKNSFEHEIDPELLAEIEEWEKAEHDEPAEYYFSNPDPYLKPQPLPPDHPRHNCYSKTILLSSAVPLSVHTLFQRAAQIII